MEAPMTVTAKQSGVAASDRENEMRLTAAAPLLLAAALFAAALALAVSDIGDADMLRAIGALPAAAMGA
jgi:hypothetical protein